MITADRTCRPDVQLLHYYYSACCSPAGYALKHYNDSCIQSRCTRVASLQQCIHAFHLARHCSITALHMEWQACYGLNYYNVCLNPSGYTMHFYNYNDVCIHSSRPSVTFSQYQYNYPEINNGEIIIPSSLTTNAYTCSFSCIRLRNPLH
jgi:hypothetical protein